MSKALLIISLIFPIFFIACNDDEPELDITADLHYDSANFAAPELDPGTHFAGVYFPETNMQAFIGQNLEEIVFFLNALPSSCSVHVYRNGIGNVPGQNLYSKNITADLESETWNFHTLETPVPLTGEDIWICIEVTHSSLISTVGCDPGPATTNGDWIRSTPENDWTTLRERTSDEVDINWNIRARIN